MAVRRLVGKIKLRGQQTAARRLNLNVVVPRPAGIDCRHDSVKAERAVRPGYDVAAIPEPDVVVFARLVGMPEFDHRATDWAAISRQHEPGKFELIAFAARLAQVAPLRGFWPEKWPLGLADGRLIVVTRGRGGKLLRHTGVGAGQFPTGSKHAGVEQKSAAGRSR